MDILHGVITSMLTPFTPSLQVDEETLASEIEYQIDAGVHGICVLGGTGESLSLNWEEREQVVKSAVKAVSGRVPLVVGCFVPLEEQLISFANRIEELGATAMMLTPPPFYKSTVSQFQSMLMSISSGTKLPLVVYNAPKRAGVNLTGPEICQLVSEVPSIVGVKDASGSITDLVKGGNSMNPRAALLQGMDDIFLPTLAAGGRGGILAVASPLPELMVKIYNDWKSGNVETALRYQLSLIPVMNAVNREPMPILVKEAMKVVGRPMGETRRPLYDAAADNKKELWRAMEEILSAKD